MIRGVYRRHALGRRLAVLFVGLVLLFLFAPLVIIIVFSFNASSTLNFPLTGITTGWYRAAFADSQFVSAFLHSLVLGGVTAVVSGVLGTMAAFGMRRFGGRTQNGFAYAALLPAIVPALVLAIAIALSLQEAGVYLSLRTAVIGHILISFPFVVLTLRARLDTFDFRTLEAARDLGATRRRAFWDVTFPLILPSILGAALICTSLSLDEFVITEFTIGNDQTLPTLIWERLREGVVPTVNAFATIILCGTLLAGLASYRISRIRL